VGKRLHIQVLWKTCSHNNNTHHFVKFRKKDGTLKNAAARINTTEKTFTGNSEKLLG